MTKEYTEAQLIKAEKWYRDNRHFLDSGEVCRYIGIDKGNFSRWVNDKPQFNGSPQRLTQVQRIKLAEIRDIIRK